MECYYKKIDKEELSNIVQNSKTFAEVMRKLGYTANRGNSYQPLKKYLRENNISFSHFLGKSNGLAKNEIFPLEKILVKDSIYTNMTRLKLRILKSNLIEYKCAICGINEWLGKKIVLQLDHINGNNRDNRIENLRLLCPNCHSQTETYCGKNKT
jgi:5-methylcytosine-specific restriction endonuclease McrA